MKKEKINVRIGTKKEAAWEKIREGQEETVRNSEINLAISQALLKLAEEKILEEQK